jgi:hypothetical protein
LTRTKLAKRLDLGVKDGLCDPDNVPAPPDEAVTRPGDLWLLGDYRLLCVDAGKSENVDRLLDGASIHLVNTDPPYNVKVEPRSDNAIAVGLKSFKVTHHQKMDFVRHPEKAKPTGKKLRAKDSNQTNSAVLWHRSKCQAIPFTASLTILHLVALGCSYHEG